MVSKSTKVHTMCEGDGGDLRIATGPRARSAGGRSPLLSEGRRWLQTLALVAASLGGCSGTEQGGSGIGGVPVAPAELEGRWKWLTDAPNKDHPDIGLFELSQSGTRLTAARCTGSGVCVLEEDCTDATPVEGTYVDGVVLLHDEWDKKGVHYTGDTRLVATPTALRGENTIAPCPLDSRAACSLAVLACNASLGHVPDCLDGEFRSLAECACVADPAPKPCR